MQLGCVQLIISLDYLLNVVSRQPSGSWRREGWAALIKSDAETREKAAKQRTHQYLKCLTSSQTQTDPHLSISFECYLLIIITKSDRMHLNSSCSQYLNWTRTPFSPHHIDFIKIQEFQTRLNAPLCTFREGKRVFSMQNWLKLMGKRLFFKKGLPKLAKSKSLYISTPPLTSCFVTENGAEPTPL